MKIKQIYERAPLWSIWPAKLGPGQIATYLGHRLFDMPIPLPWGMAQLYNCTYEKQRKNETDI